MTTLIFVRHGQSESNLAQRFTGQGETALTPLGHLQALRTAEFLADRPIDLIYSSDLSRAMQTAEPTAKRHGLEILPRRQLREVYAGEWEGRSYAELLRCYPESYARWKEDIGHAQPDGGESVQALAARIYAETQRILFLHRGKNVAIFTHATPVRMMACKWFGYAPEDAARVPFAGNASVSVVEYADDGSHRLICYGYDKHQGDAATGLPKNLV